jgi:hypothetical protein
VLTRLCSGGGKATIFNSPDLNPIEEFFSVLKQFIKRKWNAYEMNPNQGFDAFLEWCVDVIGSRVSSAAGHFRNAGLM